MSPFVEDISVEKTFRKAGYTGEDAITLMARTKVLKAIKAHIEKRGWTQIQAAEILGVRQPRISEIYGLRIDKFSLELLLKYANRIGLHIKLDVSI